jgi:Flp pilus assembly protein TadD
VSAHTNESRPGGAAAPAAPAANDAWYLHSQGRRFGPLSEDEMRGYFRAGMVKAGDAIGVPGQVGSVPAETAAALLGMPPPPAGPVVPVLPAPIIIVQPREGRASWLLTAAALIAIIGVSLFAIHQLLQLPGPAERVAATPPAVATPLPATGAATNPTPQPQPEAQGSIPSAPLPAAPVAASAAIPPPAAVPQQAAIRQADRPVEDEFYARATTLSRAEDWSGLLSHASNWTVQEPRRTQAWWYLGFANAHLGTMAEAEGGFRKALELAPGNFEARFSLANVYLRMNRYPEAVVMLQDLAREQPGNAGVWNDLGVGLVNTGEFDDAVAAYQKALQLEPDYRLAWANLATCYAHFGYPDRAKAAAEKANAL